MPDQKELTKQLSVLVVAFNDTDKLKRCIDSACKQLSHLDSWEIIIINNDKEIDINSLSLDFSKVNIIDHGKNVGFGRAINMGAKKASGQTLLILNPDTEILTDNIHNVLSEFSHEANLGIVGGGIIKQKGKKQEWSAGKEASLYDLIRNNLGISRSKNIWNSKEKVSCDWVAGTTMFIRKDLFDELEGFDENYFMYFEDMDLCHRARQKGKKVILFPDFKIFHSSGGSYTDKQLQKKHYYDSMEKFFKKNSTKPAYWIIKALRRTIIRK
ncbi:MAG: glycosyltransferase family 2 protein [Patescibacteria group bacterium]|nr:glycosyltransferase family 2 protein [Patescibacteria group bacterium]